MKGLVVYDAPFIRFARVFNGSQIEGIPKWDKREITWDANQRAEKILNESGAAIDHDQRDQAYYLPKADEIHLPPRAAFETSGQYYATVLHELAHWTGHKSRYARKRTWPSRQVPGGTGAKSRGSHPRARTSTAWSRGSLPRQWPRSQPWTQKKSLP